MITREEVLEIEEYCVEHKVTHKARLAELGIQFWDFYKAKKKYREEDSMDTGPGQFVQLSSGRYVLFQVKCRLQELLVELGNRTAIENVILPIAVGRKNYLFCGNHDAAVRAAIVYSLFSSCKAHDVDVRTWLEDILKRIPEEKDIDNLLPHQWQPLAGNSH